MFRWRRIANVEKGKMERRFRLDIIDRDKEFLVRCELPGVEKDGVEVTCATVGTAAAAPTFVCAFLVSPQAAMSALGCIVSQ